MWKVKKIHVVAFILFLSFNGLLICFVIPMVYPYGYSHNFFGIPVSQPHCELSNEKYYLTIVVMVKNRAHYMTEWLEFHFMVGVQHIYIYDNDSSDNLHEVLSPYIRDNVVTVIPFQRRHVILIDGSEEIMTQKLVLKNSIETYACETRWMAMIDSDEFILPAGNTKKTLVKILKRFEGFTSVVTPWLYFTSNGWVTTATGKLVIEAYTRRWKKPKHTWKHILQPKRIKSVYSCHNFQSIPGYHSVNENMQAFANWPGILNGRLTRNFYYKDSYYTFNLIKLHHYKLKSAEDWEIRLTSGQVSGFDNGLSDQEIYEHWKEYFTLENADSETDISMFTHVERLRKNIQDRRNGSDIISHA